MVHFLNSTAGTEDNTVVALMILQIIVVFLVRKGNIALFRKKKLRDTAFIDHVAAVHCVYWSIRVVCLLVHHAPLDAVGSIAILHEAAGRKSDVHGQI